MSTNYYIRTTDRAGLLALACQIGLLHVDASGRHTLVDPHAGIWDEVGEVHRPTGAMATIPEQSGAYTTEEWVDGQMVPTEHTYITPAMEVPVTAPLADAEGTPYWHANLMLYEVDLLEMTQAAYLDALERIETAELDSEAAAAVAQADALAAAMASIPSYFVADADGKVVSPNEPVRVFG